MEGKRIRYLDYCKGIAILLVSFGHILGNVDETIITQRLLLICYAIELPLFFIVDGIQFRLKTNRDGLIEYVKKRAIRLMYPYFTFSFCYILFDVLVLSIKAIIKGMISPDFLFMDLIDTFTLWGIGPLWFLPTMYFADVVFYSMYKNKKSWILFLVSTIGICGSYYFEPYYMVFLSHSVDCIYFIGDYVCRIFVATSFICLGYYSWPYINRLVLTLSNHWKEALIGGSVLLMGGYLSLMNDSIVDLHFGYIRNPIITYTSAILLFVGIILILSQCKSRFLGWLGKNTLVIMGLQIGTGYVVLFGKNIVNRFGLYIESSLLAIIYLLVFLSIATACTWFINKHMPYLLSWKGEKNDKLLQR